MLQEGPIVAQTNLNLGSITTCDPYRDTTIEFTNSGCDTLFILSGPGNLSNEFSIDGITFPIVIPPDSSVSITFHFRGTTVGNFSTTPHFDTKIGKVLGTVDLSLTGAITQAAGRFTLSSDSIGFAPLTICTEDSAEIVYINTGCDTLYVTPEGILGDSDFADPDGTTQAVVPGDTIRFKVLLHPQQHGL